MFEGRGATDYDHGYDARVFYRGLALDPKYVEGFIEGCLERIAEDRREGAATLRRLLEREDAEHVVAVLKSECEVRSGRGSY